MRLFCNYEESLRKSEQLWRGREDLLPRDPVKLTDRQSGVQVDIQADRQTDGLNKVFKTLKNYEEGSVTLLKSSQIDRLTDCQSEVQADIQADRQIDGQNKVFDNLKNYEREGGTVIPWFNLIDRSSVRCTTGSYSSTQTDRWPKQSLRKSEEFWGGRKDLLPQDSVKLTDRQSDVQADI